MIVAPLQKGIQKLLVTSGYFELGQRQRFILGLGVLIVLLLLSGRFIIQPVLQTRARLHHSISRKERQLKEIKKLRYNYFLLKEEAGGLQNRLSKRPQGFSLFSFLDAKANETGVKGRVSYMKPSTVEIDESLVESVVEIKLDHMTLRQLVDFLQVIESTEQAVVVKRIVIQANSQDEGYLDIVLKAVTFLLKKR